MKDTYRHKGLRRRLLEEVRDKGIDDEAVLEAMDIIPRHFFLPKDFEKFAYEDQAFPIGKEQTISQPYTVAYQTALLEVKNTDKILEIGTGSGYQAAILSALAARVYSVERQEELYHKAQDLLELLGFQNIFCFFRDGTKGLPEFAPYDKILVTAGAERVPKALKEQLKIGGMLVIPVGKEVQKMQRITRLSETEYQIEKFDRFRFVPFLKGVIRKLGD